MAKNKSRYSKFKSRKSNEPNNTKRYTKQNYRNNQSKNQKTDQQSRKKEIRHSTNIIKRKPYPEELLHTSNALNWGDRSQYKFKDFNGQKVRIIPISGLRMIGTNCTVIEDDQDIIIIDAGLGFPEFDLAGVDALVPNLSYLNDRKDRIRGIIITHGHTDHIGGLHYIYEKIGCPRVYAPRLAAEMIKDKFKELKLEHLLKISTIDSDSNYYLGKFKISHFRMNHTIMDNYGICIDTPVGRIVTPSDYKIDLTPYKEPPSDYSKLTKLGDEGVLLLMDESTNVKLKGWAPSETSIAEDLENTIRDADGRLIIGLFSTMISRMRQIIEIAAHYNKKIVISGKSLETNIRIAHRLGYIDVLNSVFIPPEDMDRFPDNAIVILTTGSQGEPNAALMRMAQGEHNRITLKPTDTIVFSSSRIPGNENKIDRLINLLAAKGCRILTSDNLVLHASGHGHKEDHKLMLQLVKPKFIMPIHGEPSMLAANKENAMTLGYKEEQIIIAKDGDVIELWPGGWEIVNHINSEPLWVEGNRVGDFDMSIINERKIMTEEGVIVLTIKMNTNNQYSYEDFEIQTKGFFVQSKDTFIQKELSEAILRTLNQLKPESDKDTIHNIIKFLIEQEIGRNYQKKPLIVISIL
ncbi:MAG: ribonuclease J [Candidatus Dojkabacteria bacterium]|nr:MAG: ribonuclease J [Candidatus Dojkabacteria bacterium]